MPKTEGKRFEKDMTLEERFLGRTVQYCLKAPVTVNRFNPGPGPNRGPFTTTHDVMPAVVVAIDESGKADLKVLPIGGKGSERVEGVEMSATMVRPECWTPEGVTAKAKPEATAGAEASA